MSTAKLKRLKAAGWKAGSAGDFLQLSDEEAILVELKLMLTDAIKASRQKRGLSQIDLARKMGSSQSGVAKIEAGDRSVSLDLIMRAFGAGGKPAAWANEFLTLDALGAPSMSIVRRTLNRP